MKHKTSISFLSSKSITKDLMKLDVTDTDYIHVDVMDGKFVKNKSLTFKELKYIGDYTRKRLDVHLMVKKPKKYIEDFVLLNTEYITIHLEIDEDIKKIIDLIHEYGIKAGLAIKPGTDTELVEQYIDDVDMILVMSVEPGFGGQEFLVDTTRRVDEVKDIIKEHKKKILVEVDGGINKETRPFVKNADILVSGSYIVKSENFQEAIDSLR